MKFKFLFILSLFSLVSTAQLLRNETALLNAIKGDTLFVLKDSTKVSLADINESWYKTTAVVLIERSFWNNADSSVIAGAKIYNADKEEIGIVKADMMPIASRIEDVRKYRKHVWVMLEGFVYNRNVHYKSIPEKGIEKIVNAKSRGGVHANLVEYFETYGFKKLETADYTYWIYLDENASIEEEKPYRVGVIFRGETSLFCVVTYDRPFEMLKLKLIKDESSGTYYFTSKPNDKAFEVLEDQIYSYIPL